VIDSRGSPRWYARPAARTWTCAPARAEVRAFHAGLPGYGPTPLLEVPVLAARLGVGRVLVKDESARMGLPAFKVLGASWAIRQVLSRRPAGRQVLLVAATDGNHGRAVARMARLFGQQALVFVPSGVHHAAVAAIAAEGARVSQTPGTYDEAVRLAADAAREPGAVLVQDTAWPGYEQVPGWIVEGYSTLFGEIDAQLSGSDAGPPRLVVVPAGLGSLAQAAVIHYRSSPAGAATALLSVEPDTAAGVLTSLAAGQRTSVPTGLTIMAGLNCGTPSGLAWPYLREGLDAAIAITDAGSAAAVRELARHGIPAGPCGGAALAGARAALTGEDAAARRAALGVGPDATVLLICTEGAAANPATLTGHRAAPQERRGPPELARRHQPGPVEVARRGPRARDRGDRARVQPLAAVRARRYRRDDVLAGGMPGLHGRAAGGRPAVAPLAHRRHHVPQIAALGRQPVLRARRVILIPDASEDPGVDQVIKALGQDVAGDAEASLEIIEAGHAEERIPDDEQAPPLAHHVQALRDRAGDALETGPLHESKHRGLHNRTHTS
jgi:diaminopropionate ammonia-lyase